MNRFLTNCIRDIRSQELVNTTDMLRTFMLEVDLAPLFAPPNTTAGFAFALGVRYGKHIERERRNHLSSGGAME